MKIVIIDDEKSVRNNLRQIINEDFAGLIIVGEAHSVKSGIELIEEVKPDLVLLDINLADGSGFTLLEQVAIIDFQTIFITAYDEFAIKAFQFNAIDYVLKPVESESLGRGIDKAKKLTNKKIITKSELEAILSDYTKNDEEKRLAIHESGKISYVDLKDMIRCTADSNYTVFHFSDTSQKTTSKTLKYYEKILPKSMFYRVSPSCIVNLKCTKEYRKGGSVLLSDGVEVDVSRRRKDDFLAVLKERSA